jgi:hypothetical protein
MEGLRLRLLGITGFSVVMGFSLVLEGFSEGMEELLGGGGFLCIHI